MDIRAITKPIQELTFSIEFHFAPNKYFTDTVLTKTYLLSCTPEAENPFIFDGPEIVKSIGCQINWNSDESVTEKIFDGNKYRSDSFFNFFNPPKMGGANDPEDQDKIDVNSVLF